MDEQTLKKLQRIYDQADNFGKSLMEKEFPKLKESEDEEIRHFLTRFVKINAGVNISPDYAKKALAWLEKQGKKWSEEDEDAWDIAIRIIQNGGDDCAGILDSNKALNWLKSLKQRFTHEKEEEN